MRVKVQRIKAGQIFGRWTATKDAFAIGKHIHVKVKCVCGTERTVMQGNLYTGGSSSCGCLNAELAKTRFTTHGFRSHLLYAVWNMMKQRCHTPTSKQYKDYGGRNISVCSEWRENFQAFYAHVGERPFEGATVERKDNNGNYEPSNVVWATRDEQIITELITDISNITARNYS